MRLTDIFPVNHIISDLRSQNKKELFDELIQLLVDKEKISNAANIKKTLWMRENMLATWIADGVALPHTQVKNQQRPIGVLGISRKGIDYNSPDGKPVHIIFLLIDDESDTINHLLILRDIAVLVKNSQFFSNIMKCSDSNSIYNSIREFEDIERIV